MKYYKILCDDNQRKYAYFKFGIKWNVSMITNKLFANGYIVQKVICVNSSDVDGIETQPYYEAWKISNGECIESTDKDPDDIFEWGSLNFVCYQIANSLGKSGSVVYRTQVYWIEENDPLYAKVDEWKKGAVVAAGELKSCYVVNCPYLNSTQPVFTRPDFIHRVDFTDPKIIKKGLLNFGEELSLPTENFKLLVQDILEGTDYEFLLAEL